MRLYTMTGDDGTTGRFLGGRVEKSDLLIEASGDIDEAVAALGVARAGVQDHWVAETILARQRELFVVGADLSVNPEHRDRLEPGTSLVTEAMVSGLESLIDQVVSEHPLEPVFIVPGDDLNSARLDLARTIVRRAERHVVGVSRAGHVVSPEVLQYLNRLSDLLYALARAGVSGTEPTSRR
jgi:cob(I)alamin adenosyltransferase